MEKTSLVTLLEEELLVRWEQFDAYVVSIVKNTLQRRKALAEELDSLAGFKVSQSYLDDSGNTAIAI
ncbi:MAG: hypothetical protein WBJ12_09175, partial [Dethiobacteria bacterium]